MSCAKSTRLIDELDALLRHIDILMHTYEDTGFYLSMREDYIALHDLQSRALHKRWEICKESQPSSQEHTKQSH